jgi:CheY-like chemotaxis protein/nitrogen-specific signal transduction histidine kinase
MARSRSKAKSVAKAARRRSSRRAGAARAHEAALAAFAHDIRTALTGILALGELLASSTLGKNERSWAAGIKASAEHLASLTTLVLDAAKAETGSLTLREEVFRPRRLVEFLVDSLATRAQAKGLAAEANIADNLPDLLVGDAVRLRAALENLIDNAVKFTERGAVRLEARASPAGRGLTRLVVAVHDSGIGLKPAEIKRLFRPFAQASAEIARHYGGSGLGLAIVKRLAKLMGGDLTVASTPGRGSSFRFTAVMPIVSADAAGSPSGRATPARPLAILCAEDNPYGRVILNTILTELGHRADFVNSGEDAVAAVTRGYDFVLMDVAFPGIDGLEAARRIRALPGVAGRTPIVGISGASEARDEEATRAAGMDFYLRKPVSPSAVSEAIAAVVSRNKD